MAHSTREDNRPSFAFYPDDWLTDAGLIISEPEERGVWIDMLCFMFKSPIRGAMLNPDGSQMTVVQMAKLLRVPEKQMAKIMANLLANGVARRLEDGTICNWRMYRKDKDLSQKRSEAGFKGAIAKWDKEGDGKPMASEMANDGKDGLTEKKKNIEIEEVKEKEVMLEEIINYLNLKTGKHYKFTTPKTKDFIKLRMNEGFSVANFKTVIDNQVKEWGNDHKMAQYLRPETLFGTKFESYLNAKIIKTKEDGDY
jgi:uncharacterized phage protein (TIGR02220 family)